VDTVPDTKAFQPQGMVHFAIEGAMNRDDVQLASFEGQPNPGRARQRAGVVLVRHGLRRRAGFDAVGRKPCIEIAAVIDH
jgi:hypothetical protein